MTKITNFFYSHIFIPNNALQIGELITSFAIFDYEKYVLVKTALTKLNSV